MTTMFLRPDVVVEPLVCQWYAIPFLIPPATAAVKLQTKYLPILRSFVKFPKMHQDALKNPAMSGGPFVNEPPSSAPAIAALIERMEGEAAPLMTLGRALKDLDKLVGSLTHGETIEPLYKDLPPPLRGYVELNWDLHHQARARVLEGLLYKSPYYLESLQEMALGLNVQEVRAFAQATPRIEGEGRIILRRPFRDPSWEALSSARFNAVSPDALGERLGVQPAQRDRFLSLFTDRPPPPPAERFSGEGIRLRYFGHSCMLIESKEVCLLTDPVIASSHPTGPDRFSFGDLPPKIDFVLLTHAHPDHVWLETLLPLRDRIGTIVVPKSGGASLIDPSLKLTLKAVGFGNVVELDELESLALPGGELLAVPFLGEHGDLPIRTKSAWLVRAGGRAVLAMGDSNAPDPELYRHLAKQIGRLDALLVGMESLGAPMSWGYGEYFPVPPSRKADQSRRLNSVDVSRALPIVDLLEPRHTFVYSMGLEPWTSHLMGIEYGEGSEQMLGSTRLMEHCRARGWEAARPFAKLESFL